MAHDKVYAICENMCLEETLTKGQIETLISADEAVISTEVTITGNGSATAQLALPEGFTVQKTMIVAVNTQNQNGGSPTLAYATNSQNNVYCTGAIIFSSSRLLVYLTNPTSNEQTKKVNVLLRRYE